MFNLAELCIGCYLNFLLDDTQPSWTLNCLYWMAVNLAECSIWVTVLLEHLDLWFYFITGVPFKIFFLYYCPPTCQVSTHPSTCTHVNKSIYTKVGIAIHFNDSFMCAKISAQSMHFALYGWICEECEKIRNKKNETLSAHISEMTGVISFKFGM